jgi:GR25 family glycosyltransferase involved in LPS biosynthesis
MSILNERFDKVVCINLLERKDKFSAMDKRFKAHDIEVEWFHPVIFGFNPIIAPVLNKSGIAHFNDGYPNEIGAATSHYTVIKTALLQDINKLFVFEDDCAFHNRWDELLPKYLDALPEDWDCFLFYSFMYNILPENKRVNAKWTRAFKSWSLICYGMNKRFMEEYIKRQDNFFTISDLTSFKMQEEGFNVYVATPPLIIPAKDLSSNIRINKNYEQTRSIILLGINEKQYI